MHEHDIIGGLLHRIGEGLPATAPLARALLEWALPQRDWLLAGAPPGLQNAADWGTLLSGVRQARPLGDLRPAALDQAAGLARLLRLGPVDSALLVLLIAAERLPRLAKLLDILGKHERNVPALLGQLAGAEPHDAERAVRQSPLVRLGLIEVESLREGGVMISTSWRLAQLLHRGPCSPSGVIDLLVGLRQPARLSLADFGHVRDAPFLVRLLSGALAERAAGVNILIHGSPGTGKTELARTLAAAAGAVLRSIGEADSDGEEPSRYARVNALQLAQHLLGSASAPRTVLLFDEMEDLVGDGYHAASGRYASRAGSKLFVNRLLETNALPVIWTTNSIGPVDPAILRRMSFILKLDLPPRTTAINMLGRIAAEEGVAAAGFAPLLEAAPEATTVLRVAARAARLAGGVAEDGPRAAGTLVAALRGEAVAETRAPLLDLDLFEADRPLAPLFAAWTGAGTGAGMGAGMGGGAGAGDVSLLLSGPPGTGKTALAHHLARALDKPLLVKRASDLLSKWVGETEAQIAEAFAEARRVEGVLLLDEVDSLLFDRAGARSSWEVGQVNELLTWLDRHPHPVVAATNAPDALDPATLRRFVFKLDLRPLGPARAARAFAHFFARPAPPSLAALRGLTPGDYALVARQLRYAPAADAEEIVARLAAEVALKRAPATRIGF